MRLPALGVPRRRADAGSRHRGGPDPQPDRRRDRRSRPDRPRWTRRRATRCRLVPSSNLSGDPAVGPGRAPRMSGPWRRSTTTARSGIRESMAAVVLGVPAARRRGLVSRRSGHAGDRLRAARRSRWRWPPPSRSSPGRSKRAGRRRSSRSGGHHHRRWRWSRWRWRSSNGSSRRASAGCEHHRGRPARSGRPRLRSCVATGPMRGAARASCVGRWSGRSRSSRVWPRPAPSSRAGWRGAAASSGRVLESTEYAVVGVTPLIALATDTAPYLIPLQLWFLLVLLAGRFTVRPLARLATRATLQRDLVVAATEAERARVAADIHDDALQELTLLVQRLDAAGDTEGADIARTVSDRLRAICGDLRLPILDDLGRRAGARLARAADRAAGRRRGPPRADRRDAAAAGRRARVLPRRPGGARRTRSSTASRRSSFATSTGRGRIAVDRRRRPRDRARRRRRGRAGRPLRAAEHAAAGRGDRGDPRHPPLAGRRDAAPRMAWHCRRARH